MVTALHMGWQHALFANWPSKPELLDAHLPSSPLSPLLGRRLALIVQLANVFGSGA